MRDKASEVAAGKPRVQMQGGWLQRERRRQAAGKIERHGMIGHRADRCRNSGNGRRRGAMHMPGGNQAHPVVPPEDGLEPLCW